MTDETQNTPAWHYTAGLAAISGLITSTSYMAAYMSNVLGTSDAKYFAIVCSIFLQAISWFLAVKALKAQSWHLMLAAVFFMVGAILSIEAPRIITYVF